MTRIFNCLALSITFIVMVVASSDARFPRGGANNAFNSGGMLLDLGGPTYYFGYSPLLNWWKTGQEIVLVSSVNGTLSAAAVWNCDPASGVSALTCTTPTKYLEANGELVTPVPADVVSIQRLYFTADSVAPQWSGTSFNQFYDQVWNVSWTGCAAATGDIISGGDLGGTGSGYSFPNGTNAGTVTFGHSNVANNVYIKFTMNTACRASPPKGVFVSLSQYSTQVAACKAGTYTECFDPEWINDVKNFGVLRLMDWMSTNYSGISDISQLANWSDVSMFNSLWGSALPTDFAITAGSFTTSDVYYTPLTVGCELIHPSITPGTTITTLTSTTTGTVTPSQTVSLAYPFPVCKPAVGSYATYGPKGGIHPDVAIALARKTGAIVEYPFPVAATDTMVTAIATAFRDAGVRVKYSLANEFFNQQWQYRYASVKGVQATASELTRIANYSGFRSSQVFSIIRGVYGSRLDLWAASFGGWFANTSYGEDVLQGALTWIAGGGAYTLAELTNGANFPFGLDVAPYLTGTSRDYIGYSITGATAGATTAISVTDAANFTNGGCVYVVINGGTMSGVLNGVQATITTQSSSLITVSVNTTGLIYGGSGNYVMSCTLWKLVTESAAKFASPGPPAYPNVYSYFAQQQTLALLNGSATGTYGTLYCNDVTCGTSMATTMAQHNLIVGSYGVKLSMYEGGNGAVVNNILYGGPSVPQAVVDAISAANFDVGVIGDTSCSGLPCNIARQNEFMYSAFRAVNAAYPSQFVEAGPVSKYGPWPALRYLGDTANPKWTSVVAENALGPYVPVYPSAPGTYTYLPPTVANANESTAATTFSFNVNIGTAATYVVVCYANQETSSTLTGITVGGVALSSTADAINTSTGNAAIFSGAVPAGTATRAVVPTFGSSNFFQKMVFVYSLSGLANNAVAAATNGNGGTSPVVSVTKNAAVIGCGTVGSGTPNWSGGSSNVVARVSQASGTTWGSTALFKPTFSSSIFPAYMGAGVSGSAISASYR